MKRNILFISRNYPPRLGGLEVYSYNLIKEFEEHHSVFKIVLTKSKLHLFWFLPYSLIVALIIGWKYSIRYIHLCDGLLSPIGFFLKLFTDASLSISIHGLDITYNNTLHQWLIPRCVARLDKIICVSRSTRDECVRRGISKHKCTVIPNGIRPDELYLPKPANDLRLELVKLFGVPLQDKKVLTTVGRLVKRKGIAWFVDRVMPKLDASYIYIIAGDGPEYQLISSKVKDRDLQNRVLMLGRVSDKIRRLIYNSADVFIMPNITIVKDVEGFGIVVIEAGSCGLPVVASKIQGLKDAVIEGKSGYLVEEGDVDGFLKMIRNMGLNREAVRSHVNAAFGWTTIFQKYQNILINRP